MKETETTRNENDFSTYASITSSQFKQDTETNKVHKDIINRNIRSVSCQNRQNTTIRGREASQSPRSSRNELLISQISEGKENI